MKLVQKSLYIFLVLGSASFASTVAPTLIRSFDCKAYIEIEKKANEKVLKIVLDDYKLDEYNYFGTASFEKNEFFPDLKFKTGETGYDLQEGRDDNPEGRQGWGGTAFYGAFVGSEENPKEAYTFITKAVAEQMDRTHRNYQFVVQKIENPQSSNEITTNLIQGLLRCKMRR